MRDLLRESADIKRKSIQGVVNYRLCARCFDVVVLVFAIYVFSRPNIRKEGKMGFIIAVLVVVILVIVIMQLT